MRSSGSPVKPRLGVRRKYLVIKLSKLFITLLLHTVLACLLSLIPDMAQFNIIPSFCGQNKTAQTVGILCLKAVVYVTQLKESGNLNQAHK